MEQSLADMLISRRLRVDEPRRTGHREGSGHRHATPFGAGLATILGTQASTAAPGTSPDAFGWRSAVRTRFARGRPPHAPRPRAETG